MKANVTNTGIIKRIGYTALAGALVLGLSPATLSVAEAAGTGESSGITSASEEAEASTTFTFSDDGIVATGGTGGYKISTDTKTCSETAQVLSIQKAGTYEISGSCACGYIEVKKGLDGVTLVLNGLTLSMDGEKAIKFKAGCTNSKIVLKGTNSLSTDNDKGIIKAKAYEENDAVVLDENGYATGGDLTIDGDGTLKLKSSYKATVDGETVDCDAINAEGNLTVLGGTYDIDVTDDGMHSDYVLTIGAKGTTGPDIKITKATEGLEGATVNLLSGTGDIVTSDDGVNAANSDLADYNYQYGITVAGGTWKIVAGGDGIDSNGNLTVSGGETTVYCTGNGNGALDYGEGMEGEIRGTFSYTGGTLLAVGSDMMVTPSKGIYVVFGGQGGMGGFGQGGRNASAASSAGTIVSKGAALKISDGSNTLYSGTAAASGSYAIFMSEALSSGTSYTLTSGSSTTSATAGSGSSAANQGGQQGQPGQQQGQQDGQPGQPGGQAPSGQDGSMPQPPTQDGQQDQGQRPGQPGQPGGQQDQSQGGSMPQPPQQQGNEWNNQQIPGAGDMGNPWGYQEQPGVNGDPSQQQPLWEQIGEAIGGMFGDQQDSQAEERQDQQAPSGQATPDTQVDKGVKAGDEVVAGKGSTKAEYRVTKPATDTQAGTVVYEDTKTSTNAKSATVPSTVTIDGKSYKVTGIAKGAFSGTKVKTVTVKSSKLTKSGVAKSLKGSKVKTVKVKVSSSKKTNKKYASTYKSYFKKSNSGKSVTVK